MDVGRAWKSVWRYVLCAVAIAVLGWFAFVRGEQVPLLAAVDLGFHEFGHMLFAWAPEQIMVLAGSATQIVVPAGLAAYFLAPARRDLAAGSLMLGWAGTSAQNASVYIADAPYEALPLYGNGMHDWAFLLGPAAWNVERWTGAIASTVWVAGLLALIAGLALCAVGIARGPLEARRAANERERLATLPVHDPTTRPVGIASGEAPPAGADPTVRSR